MSNPAYFSFKDIYPDYQVALSTNENTVPTEDQREVYVKADNDSPVLVSKQSRTHTVAAILLVVAALFAFGLIK